MSDPTPAEIDALRAELASLRVTGPIPAQVVARLEATLSDLGRKPAQVTSLSSRRRRWTTGLVAAAAVLAAVAGGVELAHREQPATTMAEGNSDAQAPMSSAELKSQSGLGANDRTVPAPGPLSSSAYALQSGRLRSQLEKFSQNGSLVPTTEPCRTGYRGNAPQYAATLDGRRAVLVLASRSDGSTLATIYRCNTYRPARVVPLPAP